MQADRWPWERRSLAQSAGPQWRRCARSPRGQRPTGSLAKGGRVPRRPSLPKPGGLDAGGSVALGTPDLAVTAAHSGGGVRGHLGVLRPTLSLVKGVKVPRRHSLPKLRSVSAGGSVRPGSAGSRGSCCPQWRRCARSPLGQRPTRSIVKSGRVPKRPSLRKLRSLRAGGSVALGTSDLPEAAVLSGGGVCGRPGACGPPGAS